MLIVLKSFLNKRKLNCFKKNVHFFILTAYKNIETQKVKFEVGFLIKTVYKQFVLLKNYRLWH